MDRVHHSEANGEGTGLSPLFSAFFVECALPPAGHSLRELLLANAEDFTLGGEKFFDKLRLQFIRDVNKRRRLKRNEKKGDNACGTTGVAKIPRFLCT